MQALDIEIMPTLDSRLPTPGTLPGTLLVRVMGSSANPLDCDVHCPVCGCQRANEESWGWAYLLSHADGHRAALGGCNVPPVHRKLDGVAAAIN